MSLSFPFDNTYARMPARFWTRTAPTPVAAPRLIKVNRPLAEQLGIDPDALASPEGLQVLAGNRVPENAEPIATAYAGHQFGGFVPQLGDGRAILLGEVIDRTGVRRDIQLKGAGHTPFSRGGDGRAAVGPVLREYIVSEAMAALGIPTTRALAAVATGQPVIRETDLPGAVLTRVASSHIRVGTFQYFASRGDIEGVRLLADHVIARHYPAAAQEAAPYRALLDAIVKAQAELIAQWLLVGFIHGVMNTDNMSIAGETIDFGPCAFMDEYHPEMVFSSIDRMGRYAYARQPTIGQWNLTRLAECMLPILSEEPDVAVAQATESIHEYAPAFDAAYRSGLKQKIGLRTDHEGDLELATDLLELMSGNGADFTNTFRRLGEVVTEHGTDSELRASFIDTSSFDAWLERWRARIAREDAGPEVVRAAMHAVNPAYIPRNHRVEAAIRAAVGNDDLTPFEELLAVLSRPFDDQPEYSDYMQPPEEHERVQQTFCGT